MKLETIIGLIVIASGIGQLHGNLIGVVLILIGLAVAK